MIEHACEYCGIIKQYKSPSLVKRFCSHKCSNQWKWENVRKRAENIAFLCENCGKTFFIQESTARTRTKKCKIRFCCLECYRCFIKTKEKICINCQKSFLPKDNRNNFCCRKCYNEYVKKNIPVSNKVKLRKRTGFWYENGYKVLYNNGNSIKEHIFVMETHIGRKLLPNEVVHHIDGNKTNNNITNLRLMTNREHSSLHRKKELKAGKKLFGRDKA